MDALLGVLLAVVLLIVLAGTVLAISALWWGFRGEWRRVPPDRRRRGLIGGGLAAVWCIAGAALAIAQPWGPHSFLYVAAVGGGGSVLILLVSVAFQGIRETRHGNRARDARRQPPDGTRSG